MGRLWRANSGLVIQIPYFNDIDVDNIDAVLEGLISEVKAIPEVTPVS